MKLSAVLFVMGILVACAQTSPAPDVSMRTGEGRKSNCISGSGIRGHVVLDQTNVIVSGTLRSSYHLVLQRRAWGLRTATPIALDSPTNRICAGFGELIYRGNNNELEKIRIKQIAELTSEEHYEMLVRWGLRDPEIKVNPEPKEVEGAEVEELGATVPDSQIN